MSSVDLKTFINTEVGPVAEAADQSEIMPSRLIEACGRVGLWGWNLAERYDGGGRSVLECGRLHEEIGRHCSSLRALLTVHQMVGNAIQRWGTEAQKQQWLPSMASGSTLASFALSEAEAGSDVAEIQTIAVEADGGYRLCGTKKWVTGGETSSQFLVLARLGQGTVACLVPGDAAGVRRTPIRGMLGLRAAMLAEVEFNQVFIPRDALLGPKTAGIPHVALRTLQWGRLMVAFGCLGMMRACLALSLTHATSRVQFGTAISERQLIQRRVAEMVVTIRSVDLLCQSAARMESDSDPMAVVEVLAAKYLAARAAADASSSAVQILGARGCETSSLAGRFFRDSKVMEIIEGTTEVLQVNLAEQAGVAL